jgi:hypothetical protein
LNIILIIKKIKNCNKDTINSFTEVSKLTNIKHIKVLENAKIFIMIAKAGDLSSFIPNIFVKII